MNRPASRARFGGVVVLALLVGAPAFAQTPNEPPPPPTTVAPPETPQPAPSQPAPPDGNGAPTPSEQPQLLPATPTLPGLGRLFKDLGGDYRRLPRYETVGWLAGGATVALFSRAADRTISRRLSTATELRSWLQPGEFIGGAQFQFAAALATYGAGRLIHKPEVAHLGFDLLRVQIVTQSMTQALKLSVRRERPDGSNHFSFPSGHAAGFLASAMVLEQHYGWKVGLPAFLGGTYVMVQRVQQKQHYLSDALFGATIGMLSARAVTFRHRQQRFAVTPLAVPGGGGVAITLIDR